MRNFEQPQHFPFKVRDDEAMKETTESVKEYGVLTPAIVRPREKGGYEIVAGHRRKHACELAGLPALPALVQQRFELINSSHIEKVLDGIRENTTRVWNTRAYLLAALFNAPATTDNHYTMLVNHDLYGGR
ncbi:ParB/RepB/Spo0J family partition protein [Pseudoflavonifractor sp. 60]|nr:ParB/RepB/Spo0J family partition protein [Pseudoflavonifractor sp. 60]